ncbi:hypothetical protein B0H14DRAFT_3884546 [Mycena olivaceomarginata]|nr:hypothetical protein B0H14DRAFT_3884546 [Mycena olivaceomarginata]
MVFGDYSVGRGGWGARAYIRCCQHDIGATRGSTGRIPAHTFRRRRCRPYLIRHGDAFFSNNSALLPRLIKVSTIIVVILFVLVRIILPSFNIHGSLCILGTRARIIVFQHFARSLLPLASTTTTHRDIKLK